MKRLVASVALLAVLAGCGGKAGPPASRDPSPTATPSRGHSPTIALQRGPQPPETGAWLGAWVKPEWNTPTGRAAAFAAFEQQVGTQLRVAHMFHEWTDDFPGATETALAAEAGTLMISWAGSDTRSIAAGSYDPLIRQRAEAVKAMGVPVLLRWRWEMDRPNLAASVRSPADFIAAWKHIRAIFTDVGATNAGWVWCPHVEGFTQPGRDAAAYYPGDDQVEWLCADVYAGREFESFATQMDAFLSFAQKHPKPVLVGEYGATDRGDPPRRAAWIREVRTYTKAHPQVKALIYFAEKQNRKPVYDTTFAEDPEGLAAFREMTADPYFNPR